jgi:predicted porin
MKNKILALLATLGLVASASAVEINENLSINGFIDGSYSDQDSGAEAVGIDEVELNVIVNAGSVSGEVHIDSNDVTGNEELDIEQVHFTYTMDNGLSITFGRYGSALGLEREDPAGLYTFSRAYNDTFNFGNVDVFRREGIALGYSTGDLSLGVSIDQAEADNLNNDDINFEISASYTGVENLSLNVGWRTESDNAGDTDYTNINATYSVGKALLAAEWSNVDRAAAPASDDDAYLILVDYDFTDKLGGAIRYSEYEDGANEVEMFTIAPNYALTDSLGVIIEYSDIEATLGDDDLLAVELTYTF